MKTIRLRIIILTGMLAMTLCGVIESTASPGLSISINPASPGATAIATVALTEVTTDIESFSLELSFANGTTLQLPSPVLFARGAYFPATPFGPAPTVELNNIFESTARTKVFIDGFKPTGATGAVGTVSFTVNPSAAIGDFHDISLAGAYYSAGSQSVVTFAPSTARFTVNTSPTYYLNVSFAGTGSGTVTSDPPGLAFNTTTSNKINAGSVLKLHSKAGDYSLFTGWSGLCTGLNDCSVTMDADKTVTTTFNKDIAHQVRIDGITTQTYFTSILGALSAAATGDTIKAWGTGFTENINLNQNKELIFKGGYDVGYSSNSGKTAVTGTITISNGSLTVENLQIQ